MHYYSVDMILQISFSPECSKETKHTATQVVLCMQAEPLQLIHCSQLKSCYSFLLLFSYLLLSSKRCSFPHIKKKKACSNALLKFPGHQLNKNLPPSLVEMNTKG